MNLDQVGLQLYTVRNETAQDFLGTLRRVAGMGYRAVEFAGLGDISPEDMRSALDEYGLRALAAHTPIQAFREDASQAIADVKTLGCEFAVIPFLSAEMRADSNQVQQLAAELNQVGAMCKDEGLGFAYHNHNFEFDEMDGTTMYYMLTESTDPDLVQLELDVFWAQIAGVDPLALMEQYSGRIPLLHLKDMQQDGRSDAPVGEGVLPWDALVSAGVKAGAQWFIVEQDHPHDAMEDVHTSLRNIEQMPDPA